jgi:hypothetical protein
MSLVIVETLADTPLTPENPTATDYQILDCLAARMGTWQYSLLSSDRLRMLCVFEAPDAESVRESYAKAGGAFNRIWSARRVMPAPSPPSIGTPLTVVESIYPDGFTPDQWQVAQSSLQSGWADAAIEWVKAYVALNHSRGFWELHAPDTKVVEKAHQRAGLPFSRVWSAKVIQP